MAFVDGSLKSRPSLKSFTRFRLGWLRKMASPSSAMVFKGALWRDFPHPSKLFGWQGAHASDPAYPGAAANTGSPFWTTTEEVTDVPTCPSLLPDVPHPARKAARKTPVPRTARYALTRFMDRTSMGWFPLKVVADPAGPVVASRADPVGLEALRVRVHLQPGLRGVARQADVPLGMARLAGRQAAPRLP